MVDRFRRMHEHVLHFYNGPWKDLHRETQYTADTTARTVRRKLKPTHWSKISASSYTSEDGGQRMQGSVIYARSCHGYAVNETQKPEELVRPILLYSVPPGGLVIDCFAGSGTIGAVAKQFDRRAILIEKRQSQCEEIVKRLSFELVA